MIQRIQSLWLALAAIAALLTLKFSFFLGNKQQPDATVQLVPLTATTNFILLILTAGLGVTSAIVIFLYKDRKLQMRLAALALIISLLNLFLYYNETKKFVSGELTFTAIITFVIPIFLILALRGIYKDEKLIKSADRLR